MLIRDYRSDDLARLLQLWGRTNAADAGDEGLVLEQAVRLLGDERAIVLVADMGGGLVGAVVAALSPVTAWIYRLNVLPGGPDEQAITGGLLEQLEARVAQAGLRTLAVVIDEGAQLADFLRERGYRGADELRYFEREIRPPTAPTGVLVELGGQLIGPGLWDALKGMEEAK